MAARWEYLMVEINESLTARMTKEINDYGSQGWELVSVVARPGLREYYFKRQK